jgi:hypothetical protein
VWSGECHDDTGGQREARGFLKHVAAVGVFCGKRSRSISRGKEDTAEQGRETMGYDRAGFIPRTSALRPILRIDFCNHPAHHHYTPSVARLLEIRMIHFLLLVGCRLSIDMKPYSCPQS